MRRGWGSAAEGFGTSGACAARRGRPGMVVPCTSFSGGGDKAGAGSFPLLRLPSVGRRQPSRQCFERSVVFKGQGPDTGAPDPRPFPDPDLKGRTRGARDRAPNRPRRLRPLRGSRPDTRRRAERGAMAPASRARLPLPPPAPWADPQGLRRGAGRVS